MHPPSIHAGRVRPGHAPLKLQAEMGHGFVEVIYRRYFRHTRLRTARPQLEFRWAQWEAQECELCLLFPAKRGHTSPIALCAQGSGATFCLGRVERTRIPTTSAAIAAATNDQKAGTAERGEVDSKHGARRCLRPRVTSRVTNCGDFGCAGADADLIARNIPSAASMCYDAGANQLVIPMNPHNGLAFVPLE